ncbi:MAG: cell division protein FtsA [Candidatus Omnitrophica bacterium]|nr:cell division protein FtsA [Candidatus Omnitrophota bacterium]
MIGQKTICAIDLGSSHIVAALAKVSKKGKFDYLHVEEIASKGINNGVVSDIASLSDSIQQIVQSFKNKTKFKIGDVIVNVNGNNVSCRYSQATIPLLERGSKLISENDVKKVKHQARILGLDLEEELLHEFVRSYSIDNYGEVKNPVGLYGRKISVDLYMIISKSSYTDNIVEALSQAGLEVRNLVFSGLASSLSVLTEHELQSGCFLINMGAATTEILFFKNGTLKHVEILKIGGNNITECIASKLKISWELAEELKRSYVSAILEEIRTDEEVLVKKTATYRPIKRKLIAESCKETIDEMIELIREKIDKSSFKDQAESGIIITGGASHLAGLLELVESKVGLSTRLGKVKNVSSAVHKNPKFATVIGLISYYIDNSLLNKHPIQKGKNIIESLVNQARYIYQEYF